MIDLVSGDGDGEGDGDGYDGREGLGHRLVPQIWFPPRTARVRVVSAESPTPQSPADNPFDIPLEKVSVF